MRYFLAAGEASGDLHASQLIEQIKSRDPQAEFIMLGGDLMEKAAGVKPLIHYRDMAFMGFSEVLRNLSKIFDNLKRAKQGINSSAPDCVVLIDYPSFNLKLAKYAHERGIKVYYYISPKIWAWKSWRIKKIRRYVSRMLSILPFEPEWYARHGFEATYVGNPSVEEIDRRLEALPPEARQRRRMLLLVPGSRVGEIRNNLPIMDAVVRQFPDYEVIVAGAPGIDPELYGKYTSYPVETGRTFELMSQATAALVTSGTATLECALAGTPQVVCYRANGSKISYNLFKHILSVPYVSLPNLITGQPIVHEALLHLCTPELVAKQLREVLPDGPGHQRQLDGYASMRHLLGPAGAASRAADIITS